ncbi:MAG: bifunctional riboflavin kinase/FAD synthetase [Crocinitomicaceae bacterium]
MNIYTNLEDVPNITNPVITIGTFDGVHLGHQKVISYLNSKAKEVKGESVVFTFHPHPRMVLYPDDHHLEMLQTIEERKESLAKAKINHLIIYPFSKEFSRLSALEFVRDILVNKLGLKFLIVGYDHHFGRNREGSMANLEDLAPLYGFKIFEIDALNKEEVNISSTKIRAAVKSKDFSKVTEFLGSPFQLSGTVVAGDKIGTELGYPTANIVVNAHYKIIPPNGVYAVRVTVEKQDYIGMLNIGNRPTVSSNGESRIEVHILDFSGNIYGEEIKLSIVEYIRSEVNFDSRESLIEQIKEDEKNCRSVLLPFV